MSNRKLIKADLSIFRSVFMMVFILILFSLLIGRAVYIQLVNDEFLQEKGNERFMRHLSIPSFRGKILDRNGSILAITNMTKNVIMNPTEINIEKDEEKIKELLNILNISKVEFDKKLNASKNKNFVYMKRQVDLELADKIKDLKISGIFFENSQKRFYPSSETASHLVGFINLDNKGQEGIELSKESELKGKDGERVVLKDRRGDVIGEIGEMIEPTNGSDVKLTVDIRVQTIARKFLADTIEKHNASAGSVVVLDAHTGEILSLVNMPDYNPNTRKNLDGKKLRNRALVDVYEPGSIMKPFPISLALEKKLVNENTIFDVREVKIGNKRITDTHPKDSLSVSQIIQKSSNIGTVKVSMQLTPEEMWNLFTDVGFGRKIDIGFPGETRGIFRHWSKWKPIEQANIAFGQGVAVNLLQMTQAYQAFTNEGQVCNVSLIKNEGQGERECKRVISPKTANTMREMLYSVTQQGGTAQLAQTEFYTTAGKTGTANKVENGRYVSKYISSFVGFAPATNPRIIIGVMVDEPKKISYYGGIVAAPVFGGIASEVLPLYNVPKDKNLDKIEASLENVKKDSLSEVEKEVVPEKKEEVQIKLNDPNETLDSKNIKFNVIEPQENLESKNIKINEKTKEKPEFIQIGAFKNKEIANQTLEKFKKKGYAGGISEINVNNEVLFRVRIGPFEDKIEQQVFIKNAKSENYPTKIITE